ncbi:hypothetical protein GIB67_019917 [Kingdonia uniflora]|uniref:Rhodanese domain-containing protein n=1 Tax=Kingdonia uniflora TaxID=39325 RepID=A0A7J7MKJ3_9MAGN|nr:hypothetical protein GIB67_019917 [Kingdonia uniflora]
MLPRVPEFEEAAFCAPLNKVVRCKTKFGFHLLQVLSEREEALLHQIEPEELHLKMQDPSFIEEAQLIDVRESEEIAQASLPGFKVLPLRQFGSWAADIATKFDPQKDTYVLCEVFEELSVAELVSAMVGGWKVQLIVEMWCHGGVITTSIGLVKASHHTGGDIFALFHKNGRDWSMLKQWTRLQKVYYILRIVTGVKFIIEIHRQELRTNIVERAHRLCTCYMQLILENKRKKDSQGNMKPFSSPFPFIWSHPLAHACLQMGTVASFS